MVLYFIYGDLCATHRASSSNPSIRKDCIKLYKSPLVYELLEHDFIDVIILSKCKVHSKYIFKKVTLTGKTVGMGPPIILVGYKNVTQHPQKINVCVGILEILYLDPFLKKH